MLVPCPHCGRVVSTRSTGEDAKGYVACPCGGMFPIPRAEGPSLLERAGRRLYWAIAGGLVASAVGVGVAWKFRLVDGPLTGMILVVAAVGFLVGAVLGERFLDWVAEQHEEDA